jgi:hypothetical protein
VVAPPLGGMPERVVQTALDHAQRRRKEKIMFRVRAPLSLVAVLLLIALVALALVGSRLIQDWNALHRSSPAGSNQSQLAQPQLAQLEARSLNLPVFHSVSECTGGPRNQDNSAFGAGPLYAYGGSATTRTSRWEYYTIVLYADEPISGPILLRVRDVVGSRSFVFVGKLAMGPSVGSDTLHGVSVDQKTEAVLSEANTSAVVDDPPAKSHAYVWQITLGVPQSGSLVGIGWQIDGLGFTEVFFTC